MSISPQGYTYKDDPTANNPFWSGDETATLTATATVSNTTGTPSVTVTRQGNNLNFSFENLKGEQGEAGTNGTNGTDGVTPNVSATASVSDSTGTPAVEVTKSGTDANPAFNFAFSGLKGETGASGTNGTSPTVTSTGNTGSGQVAGYVSGTGGTITIYNGAQGTSGSDANISGALTGISITNENGVYSVQETKGDGSTSDVGSIEVPSIDNVIAEVNDSVVENTTAGYDFHTIKETEHNGTQNDVGKFYLARKQITALNSDGSFTTVDQSGNEETGQITVSGGNTGTSTFYGTLLDFLLNISNTIDENKVVQGYLNGAYIEMNYGTNGNETNEFPKFNGDLFWAVRNYNTIYMTILSNYISGNSASSSIGGIVEISASLSENDGIYTGNLSAPKVIYVDSSGTVKKFSVNTTQSVVSTNSYNIYYNL